MLRAYFASCPAGYAVTPALNGCGAPEAAIADLALTTTPTAYSFSYQNSGFDSAPNLCVMLGLSAGATTWSIAAGGVSMVGTASCNRGYYQSGAACVACAAGAYCPGGPGSPAYPCSVGTWSAGGAASATRGRSTRSRRARSSSRRGARRASRASSCP
jgi:hypothetical protein